MLKSGFILFFLRLKSIFSPKFMQTCSFLHFAISFALCTFSHSHHLFCPSINTKNLFENILIYNRNNFTTNGVQKKAKHMRFNMIFNERAAIVRNFSTRYFAGATLVMNNSVFDDEAVIVNQNKWRARAFFGMRL